MTATVSQNEAIKAHLLSGKSLTCLEALYKFSCLRLGARIWELKKQGMNIKPEFIEINGKHIVKYSLNFLS